MFIHIKQEFKQNRTSTGSIERHLDLITVHFTQRIYLGIYKNDFRLKVKNIHFEMKHNILVKEIACKKNL